MLREFQMTIAGEPVAEQIGLFVADIPLQEIARREKKWALAAQLWLWEPRAPARWARGGVVFQRANAFGQFGSPATHAPSRHGTN